MADEMDARLRGETPAQEPVQPPVEEHTPPKLPPASEEKWETRFSVLQGKYNAEVVRVNAENRTLKDQLATLQSEVQALKAQADQAKQAPAAPVVTPEEVEQYGEGFTQFVQKVAASAAPKVDSSQIDTLQAQVTNVANATAELAKERFMLKLNSLVPNLDAMNSDPDFLQWLDEYDPLIGTTRQEALNRAHSSADADRVAAFFNAFAGNSNKARAARPSLDTQVVPPVRSGGPAQPEPQKPVWTQDGIRRFYEDLRRGRLKEDVAARLEQDLTAAISEGRVQ